MGYSVVGFDIDWYRAVNELDEHLIVKMLEEINDVVVTVQSEHPLVEEYAVFGTSFGTVCALFVAKQHKNICSIILNMPYGTLAHLLWTHKPSKPFKERLIQNGLSTEKLLQDALRTIETQHNLDKLSDRKIVNFTALNDKVVFDGQDFADALKAVTPGTVFHATQYGHFWGGIENILAKKKWDCIL
jgi:hypothetical protein